MTAELVTRLREQLDADERRADLVAAIMRTRETTKLYADRFAREVNAKRRILDEHEAAINMPQVVKLIALPYADHDGYREEWRP